MSKLDELLIAFAAIRDTMIEDAGALADFSQQLHDDPLQHCDRVSSALLGMSMARAAGLERIDALLAAAGYRRTGEAADETARMNLSETVSVVTKPGKA